MKKIISFILAMVMLLSLCGCQGSFGSVDLQDTMDIPADGIISESIIKQIKEDNAIATFQGESNGYTYEWTVFGSDIEDIKEVNLLVDIQKNASGEFSINCTQTEDFGFPALLSVHTGEKWDALSATAYWQEEAVNSVSITGIKESILNLSLSTGMQNLVIRPDETEEDMEETENNTESTTTENESKDTSDTGTTDSAGGRVYSDGTQTEQDQYLTDPVPEGQPLPVEPDDVEVDTGTSYTCTFSIECSTILNNLADLDPDKLELVPSDGVILAATTVTFYEGESVFDVLQRICQEKGIHMEASWTPIYNSAYVEGINNLYEFDCGSESGWMYRVNGWYPNYGCSRYQLAQGDVVEWRYTCKGLGADVGCDWMG